MSCESYSCPDTATANACQAEIDANVATINANKASIADYNTLISDIDSLNSSIDEGIDNLECASATGISAVTNKSIQASFSKLSSYANQFSELKANYEQAKADAQSEITRLTEENATLARRNNQLASQKAAALAKTCTICRGPR